VDVLYFEGYDDPEIHKEMLSDEARVDNYRAAIKALCWEKSVIDVGAGTGILSEMAMDSGALCVYAIEQSKIADEA
jgi:type I protein arginine methyltransferase